MSNKHAAGGRPAFVPTNKQRQTVDVLVANGKSQRVIALVIGCDRATLRKHFREELRDGREMLVAQMGLVIGSPATGALRRTGSTFWRLAMALAIATHRGRELDRCHTHARCHQDDRRGDRKRTRRDRAAEGRDAHGRSRVH